MPTQSKVAALTFDAGASEAAVPSILATLDTAKVKATFFLTGDFARRYPDRVREIATAGHVVGNHSDTHPNMSSLPPPGLARELTRAEAAIRPLSGSSTAPWFRFPFGAHTASSIAAVNSMGYACIGWTVDTLGWKGSVGGQSTDTIVTRVTSTARPGQIILMHVGANPDDQTTLDADALPTIIERLRSMGYGFTTIDSARH